MSIFFNLPDEVAGGDILRSLSDDAGTEVTRALEVLMRALRSFETKRADGMGRDLRDAAERFFLAAKIFRQLGDTIVPTSISVPLRMQGAWVAADSLAQNLGPALRDEFARVPARSSYSVQQLMYYAADLAEHLGRTLQGLDRGPDDSSAGRKVAAEAAMLQMFGVLIAETTSEVPRPDVRVAFA
jgi:hypothetical protein